MKKPVLVALCGALALASCGSGPLAVSGDDTDLTTVSRTVYVTPAQAQALGMTAQAVKFTGPLAVTVAVKVGGPTTKNAGQKRAYASWKTNQATLSTSFDVRLYQGAAAPAVAKTGELTQTLAAGKTSTSNSRSTAYATPAPACVALDYTSKAGSQVIGTTSGDSASGPVTICEMGAQLPASTTPTPAPTLENVTLQTWFGMANGQVSAFAGLKNVPTGATVKTFYRFQHAEECGAGDKYGQFASGEWTATSANATRPDQPVFYVGVDEQDLVQDRQGVAYTFTLNKDGKTRELSGVLCKTGQ